MIDLKNKFENEEEYREFIKLIRKPCDCCVTEKDLCSECEIKMLKQAGIIRKSAREIADDFYNENFTLMHNTYKLSFEVLDNGIGQLEYLHRRVLKEAAERAERKEINKCM